MAFDRNDPADLAALKSEVNTDPLGIGYDPNGGTRRDILDKLNEPENNVGGETTGAPITARVLWSLAADNPNDFTPHGQFSEGDQFVMQQLFEIAGDPGSDLSWARDKIVNLFPANDGFRQAIEALLRTLSRAEVLFGEGTNISRDDWFAARDS